MREEKDKMPAKSEKQRKAMGAALAIKRGEANPKRGTASAKMAKSMTEKQLKEYAAKPHKKRR